MYACVLHAWIYKCVVCAWVEVYCAWMCPLIIWLVIIYIWCVFCVDSIFRHSMDRRWSPSASANAPRSSRWDSLSNDILRGLRCLRRSLRRCAAITHPLSEFLVLSISLIISVYVSWCNDLYFSGTPTFESTGDLTTITIYYINLWLNWPSFIYGYVLAKFR